MLAGSCQISVISDQLSGDKNARDLRLGVLLRAFSERSSHFSRG